MQCSLGEIGKTAAVSSLVRHLCTLHLFIVFYSRCSSEDEEEERRLAEAAVSGYSIIGNGGEVGTFRRVELKPC